MGRGARDGKLRSSLRLRTSPWQLFPVPTLTQANVPLTWRSCARSRSSGREPSSLSRRRRRTTSTGSREPRTQSQQEDQERREAEGKSDRSASSFPREGERQLEEGCGGSQRCPCASKDGGGNSEGEDGEV